MPDIFVLLLFALLLGVFIFLIRYTAYFVSRRAAERFGGQFAVIEEIINQGKVPEAWLKSYRVKIARLEQAGAGEAKVQRLGRQAKAQFTRRLKRLYDHLEHGEFYDSDETKIMVLETLREREADWQASDWRDLFS